MVSQTCDLILYELNGLIINIKGILKRVYGEELRHQEEEREGEALYPVVAIKVRHLSFHDKSSNYLLISLIIDIFFKIFLSLSLNFKN